MELIKRIDPNEGEALKRGREGGEVGEGGRLPSCNWVSLIKYCGGSSSSSRPSRVSYD